MLTVAGEAASGFQERVTPLTECVRPIVYPRPDRDASVKRPLAGRGRFPTLAERGESHAAFAGRCHPSGGVASRSNTPNILPRRAWPGDRLTRLGATRNFHHC